MPVDELTRSWPFIDDAFHRRQRLHAHHLGIHAEIGRIRPFTAVQSVASKPLHPFVEDFMHRLNHFLLASMPLEIHVVVLAHEIIECCLEQLPEIRASELTQLPLDLNLLEMPWHRVELDARLRSFDQLY